VDQPAAVDTPEPPGGERWRARLARGLVRLEPGRPSFAVGLRVAIVLTIPLAIGAHLGDFAAATIVCLGGLNAGMADTGGAPVTRWRAFVAATILNAASLALGTLAGQHVATAIPAVFVVAFVCAMANLYGNVSANVAFVVSILFMIGIGLAAGPSVVLERLWLAGIGGAWATVVALVIWPIRPFAAAEDAVQAAYAALAVLFGQLASAAGGVTPELSASIASSFSKARAAVETARSVTSLTRAGRRGSSATAHYLLELDAGARRMLTHAEGLVALATSLASGVTTEGIIQPARAVLLGVAHEASGLATDLGHGNDVDHAAGIDALNDVLAAARARGDISLVSSLRPLVDVLEQIAQTMATMRARADAGPTGALEAVPEPTTRPSRPSRVERLRSGLWTLRDNLTLDSAVFRHALRFGATAAVGVALVTSLHLVKGYWALITIAVILRPYAAVTLERALLRVGGTVVGAIIAALIVANVRQEATVIAAMFLLAFLAFSLLPLNYGLGVIFLTPTVILLIDAAAPGDWLLAGHRIENTLLGGALALVGGTLLWPRAERHDVAGEVARAVRAERELLDGVLHSLTQRPAERDGRELTLRHQQAGRAVDNAQAAFQRLLAQPPRLRGPVETLWSLADCARNVFLAASALRGHLGNVEEAVALPAIALVRSTTSSMLDAVSESLETRLPPVIPADMRAALRLGMDEIDQVTEQVRRTRLDELRAGQTTMTATARRLRELAALDRLASRVAELVSDMADAAGELAGVAATAPAEAS
jgi:uncharacterized membrane protein YccC